MQKKSLQKLLVNISEVTSIQVKTAQQCDYQASEGANA
jgi:hypothetical protein